MSQYDICGLCYIETFVSQIYIVSVYYKLSTIYNFSIINNNKLITLPIYLKYNGIIIAINGKYQIYSILTQNLTSEWNQEK